MKRISVLILFAIACISAGAQQINEQQALEKAQAFMKGKQFKSSNKVRSLSRARSKAADKESMYVFNVENKGGFVIVSGDERTEPILGYSTSGEIDYDNMPDNLRTWLEGYEAQIKAINENPKLARKKTGSEKAAIAPLIQTKWGQGSPYNLLCPVYDEVRSVTGCVATALAQVMYYHKWPNSSTAIPGYTTTTREIQFEELPATTFEWEKMKLAYEYDDTGESADAVAKLMLYCGQSMGTDYASEKGSSADIYESSLIKYFGYSDRIYVAERSNYLTSDWNDILYNELVNNRPVLYSGFSAANLENVSGHQFVLDGYDGGLFHINWGWSGSCDGFFLLSILNPAGPGGDNGVGPSMYVVNQTAVLGMEPSNSVVNNNLPEIKTETVGYISQTLYRNSADDGYGPVNLSGSITYSFYEKPETPLNIELGWGVFSKSGEFISILGYQPVSLEEINGTVNNSIDVFFNADIPEGSYYAYQVYRGGGETDWHLCKDSPSAILVDNYSNCLNLYSESAGSTSFYVRDFDVLGLPEPDVPLLIRLRISTEMITKTQRIYLWEGYEDNWKQIGLYQTYMNQGESCNVYITYLPSSEKMGKVTLRVTYTEDVNYDPRELELQIAPLKSVTINGFNYVYNEETRSAKLISYSVPGKKYVSIPAYIDIGDQSTFVDPSEILSCSVEFIEDGAFDGYGMTSVDLSQTNLKYIGSNAFRSCPLQKVSLPWGLLGIGDYAFANNDKLKTVISRTTHPFGIPDNTFDYSANTTLYVAENDKTTYESLAGWKKFRNIAETDDFEKVVTYQIEINEENFPDANFRSYLLTDNIYQPEAPGADGILTDYEIDAIRGLELRGKSIESLKGIELLSRLNRLQCEYNYLTSLDVSTLEDLETLDCSGNQLTSLDVSKNKALTTLQCTENQLKSLNVVGCDKLTWLNCSNNKLTTLDLSSCVNLDDLNCSYNQLTELDVSKSSKMTSLTCNYNQLTSLNVSGTVMKYLVCDNNKLKSLDLSNLNNLLYCYCYSNELESLKAAGCESLGSLHFYSNKLRDKVIDNLFESLPKAKKSSDPMDISIVQYDLYVIDLTDPNEGNTITPAQVEVATSKGWKVCEKSNATYNGSDPTKYVFINEENFPDEDLRNILLAEWYGQDGVITDLELPTITSLTVNGSILELTGIEYFTELENLCCNNSLITSINLSSNKKLKNLECCSNLLKTLDLSANTGIEEVILQHNKLTSIVLPETETLKKLDLEDNLLTSLDVTSCIGLEELICWNNRLTKLNVANIKTLGRLWCENNKLTEIDLTGCKSLWSLNLNNNQLTVLDLTGLVKLTALGCDNNKLKSLDVSAIRKLQSINCDGNELTSLDLSNNIALTYLHCNHNKLKALDFSGCPKIENLWMYDNDISGTAMDDLIASLPYVNNKNLPIVDLSSGIQEKNVITVAQVAALEEKGWVSYSYNNGILFPYEGGEAKTNAYAILDENSGTLTFKYGVMPNNENAYVMDDVNYLTYYKNLYGAGFISPWYSHKKDIKTVIFDESYAIARPQSTYNWFAHLESLTSVEGIENLNTSETTNMQYMFMNCTSLTELDLRFFNTAKVTNMICMFYGCTSLKTILVGNKWSTDYVTNGDDMFGDCSSLEGSDGTKYDSEHVGVDYAHVDGGKDNPGYLSQDQYGFAEFDSETGILTFKYGVMPEGDNVYWMDDVNYLKYYKGQQGDGFISPWYSHRKEIKEVVFAEPYAKARPQCTYNWFAYLESLTSVKGIENLNTSETTNMASMFEGCISLTELDLSSFDTGKVTDIDYMFFGCENLKSIVVGDLWNMNNISAGEGMFGDCTSIVGGSGTKFDSNHVDFEYARIDGGADNPGYLTGKPTVKGDVNFDSSIDAKDIVDLIAFIVGKKPARVTEASADINGDGKANIADVVELARMITK